jgi:hypothetical protein
MMKLKSPISVITFPHLYDEDEQDNRFDSAIDAYTAFMRSRIKADAASYCNASNYVAGTFEKEALVTLCKDKIADIEALDAPLSKLTNSGYGEIDFEPPSYTQYILDVDFELLLDITAVFHFAYKREFKTLETFERLQKATEHRGSQALIGEGIRLQRASILRLDAKFSTVQSNGVASQEHSFDSYPGLVR